jgi:hypothetical protein
LTAVSRECGIRIRLTTYLDIPLYSPNHFLTEKRNSLLAFYRCIRDLRTRSIATLGRSQTAKR